MHFKILAYPHENQFLMIAFIVIIRILINFLINYYLYALALLIFNII